MNHTKKVAVIGMGNIGQALAVNFTRSKRPVIIADRNKDKAIQLADNMGSSVVATDITSAVIIADILVLAIPFETITGFYIKYEKDLKGKIIIDPSNPIAVNEDGTFRKIIDQKRSAGEINAAAIPDHAIFVKAFGTLGETSLKQAAFREPDRAVLFYACDEPEIEPLVDQLILDCGFFPLIIGGTDQSFRIEVFGDLHEFGALGKPVSQQVAIEKI